ncbi:hypothetical protein ADL00_33455 [Streptomyces sp. AS58]|uniref:hypothetical protein n=1 Tax=Streptomyces sp. AS58 TaxID=1519489 RepID=UPI0006AE4225|nr:hypothetical protein [Streptomyces sp. AS58]KOV53636.1 hypothetical protein ADL00_33455 [Streptomyces sp. AS58]
MRSKLPAGAHRAVAVSAAALVTAAALVAALAPEASAAPAAPLPLPLPITAGGGEPLVNVDGHVFAQPLVNNISLPTPR